MHTHIVGSQYVHQKLIVLEQCLRKPVSCIDKPLVIRAQIDFLADGSIIAYPRIRGRFRLDSPVPLAGKLIELQRVYIIDILGVYSTERKFIVTKYKKDFCDRNSIGDA